MKTMNGVLCAAQLGWILGAGMLLQPATPARAQSTILNTNLIVNGNAEAGPTGTGVKTPAASIPGWTVVSGNPTVLPYNYTATSGLIPGNGYAQLTSPAPPDHGFQYFAAAFPSNPGALSQVISLSAASSLINAGNAEYIASGYFGNLGNAGGGKMTVAFQNSNGQTFNTVTVQISPAPSSGSYLQQQIGLIPTGTVQATVTLTLANGNGDTGIADSLSLMLAQSGTTPVLGKNLIVNPGAEQGPNAILPAAALYVPGWSTDKPSGSVAPYGGSQFPTPQSPGPADRGTNVFCGWTDGTDLYQDIDVSSASTPIDAGQVTFVVSGWLGGANPTVVTTLTYQFFDWTGKQLAPTAKLASPTIPSPYALVEQEASGPLPAGTRRVRIDVTFPNSDSVADDIGFALAAPGAAPVITPGGIVSASAFGGFTSIAPGSWIEIYGNNLYPGSQTQWSLSQFTNNVAPTSLNDVQVSVGGAAAYIDFVSPGQVNALVPSSAPIGPTTITLTNANGTTNNYPIYVDSTQPGFLAPSTFSISGKQYVARCFRTARRSPCPPMQYRAWRRSPHKLGMS